MIALLKDKKLLLLLLVILFFAFLLRFINIDNLPIFVDEAIYVRWSQVMRAESSLRFLPLSDGKQPLFMWVTIPFLKLFSDPLLAGRFVSVVSGVGTTVGIFALAYLLFKSKKVALVSALFYASSPFAVFFDRMALVDSLLTFFGVWSVFFAILSLRTLRLDMAMITGFFLGGALLTKSPALFFVILLPFLFLLNGRTKAQLTPIVTLKALAIFGVIYLIGYGLYSILKLGPNFHLIASRNQDYVYPLMHIFENPADPLISHLKDAGNWLVRLLPYPWLFLLPFVPFDLGKQKLLPLIILCLFFITPVFAQSVWAKAFTARYILFTIPFLMIFLSSVFETKSKKTSVFINIILVASIIFSLAQNFLILSDPYKVWLPAGERSGYLEDWTAGQGIKQVAGFIREEFNKNPQEKIVVGTEGYFGTLPDGLQIYLNDVREITVIGIGLGIKNIPEPLSESKLAGNKTYLVINSTRFLGEPREIGLKLIASYPKGVKENGAREELLFFEVE